MGRQLLKHRANNVYAYHNHTTSYYHRDISHPHMGYVYKGVGNGLEDKITKCWPESDLEMIEATADEYISKNRFHAYYMTVSGHLEYSFTGNSMAKKNKSAVEHLENSEAVKAYYACNIELDKAMEALLTKLEAAGVADKTLIVIAADHYPYGLEDKENENKYHYFDELAGHSIETNFELYKSALIMYSPSMKQGVDVDKVCSSIDIIPTLSNLFGFEYDSRLLMGRDIFSNSSPLVVFSNRSFITDKGKYNSVTRTFTPNPDVALENEEKYISDMKNEVNNMFVASSGILDNDYYGIVLGTKTTN
jgi:phosphoglycerol transferase MdoB-like AlkP superfamily enzyme